MPEIDAPYKGKRFMWLSISDSESPRPTSVTPGINARWQHARDRWVGLKLSISIISGQLSQGLHGNHLPMDSCPSEPKDLPLGSTSQRFHTASQNQHSRVSFQHKILCQQKNYKLCPNHNTVYPRREHIVDIMDNCLYSLHSFAEIPNSNMMV